MVSISKKNFFRSLKKQKLSFSGLIEIITPRYIQGWFFSKDKTIRDVSLVVKNRIVSTTKQFSYREDICKKFGIEGNFGFQINLDNINLIDIEIKNPKILVNFEDISKTETLSHIKKSKKELTENLKLLLKSDLIGLNGHFEGLQNDGNIHGWISAKPNYKNKLIIWFSCKGQKPIPIICDIYRPSLIEESNGIVKGFAVDPYSFPSEWSLKEIIPSFDENGFFPLPKNNIYKLPQIETKEDFESINEEEKDLPIMKNSHENLSAFERKELMNLAQVDKYLDQLEEITN